MKGDTTVRWESTVVVPVLYLMCGLSFAGKSTLAAAIVQACDAVLISLDAINADRGLGFGGDGIPLEEWEHTHQVAWTRLAAALAAGRSVVLDDTNNLRFLRDRFRDVADSQDAATWVVYLDIPTRLIHQRMRRNADTRERLAIEPEIFAELVRTFEPPAADEQTVIFRASDDIAAWIGRCLPRANA